MKKIIFVLFIILFTVSIFGGTKYIAREMYDKAKEYYNALDLMFYTEKNLVGDIQMRTRTKEAEFFIRVHYHHPNSKDYPYNFIFVKPIEEPEKWLLEDYFENTLSVLEKFLFKTGWTGIIPTARAELKKIFEEIVVGQITVVYGKEGEEVTLDFEIGEQKGSFFIELREYHTE
jgi:hypothetical protein